MLTRPRNVRTGDLTSVEATAASCWPLLKAIASDSYTERIQRLLEARPEGRPKHAAASAAATTAAPAAATTAAAAAAAAAATDDACAVFARTGRGGHWIQVRLAAELLPLEGRAAQPFMLLRA